MYSEIKASAGRGRKGLVQRREAEQQQQQQAHLHHNTRPNHAYPHSHQHASRGHPSKFNLSGLDHSARSESMEYDEHNTSYNNTSTMSRGVPTGRRGRNSKDTGLTPSVENFHLMSPGLLLTSPYPFGRTPNGKYFLCAFYGQCNCTVDSVSQVVAHVHNSFVYYLPCVGSR